MRCRSINETVEADPVGFCLTKPLLPADAPAPLPDALPETRLLSPIPGSPPANALATASVLCPLEPESAAAVPNKKLWKRRMRPSFTTIYAGRRERTRRD